MREIACSGVEVRGGISRSVRYSYRLCETDAGRGQSRRPRQKDDCTVRALSIARGLAYDAAYDLLKSAGRKSHRGFGLKKWLEGQPWAERVSFPAVAGESRMNIAAFCQSHPTGTWIVRVAKHVFCVRSGVVHDDFEQSPLRCVYSAWAIDKAPHD